MSRVKMEIICEEEQLQLIQNALEEYVRLRFGQARNIADSLSMIFDKCTEEEFKQRMMLRDFLQESIETLVRYAKEVTGVDGKKSGEAMSAEDLWIGIRYAAFNGLKTQEEQEKLWMTVLGCKPLGCGEYPLAKIKVEKVE